MKEVLGQLHEGSSRCLGVKETMDKARQLYYWLNAKSDTEVQSTL
jgi:hypothetical protein